MPTLQFSKNIRKRGRQFDNSRTQLVRSVAKRGLRSLVNQTKADTAKARSNWRVGVGSPTRAVIEPYSPYKKGSKADGLGIGERANAIATIRAGNARINATKGVSGVGLTTAIFITNNVDYINKALLPGAIEVATLEARSVVAGFRLFRNNSGEFD